MKLSLELCSPVLFFIQRYCCLCPAQGLAFAAAPFAVLLSNPDVCIWHTNKLNHQSEAKQMEPSEFRAQKGFLIE